MYFAIFLKNTPEAACRAAGAAPAATPPAAPVEPALPGHWVRPLEGERAALRGWDINGLLPSWNPHPPRPAAAPSTQPRPPSAGAVQHASSPARPRAPRTPVRRAPA